MKKMFLGAMVLLMLAVVPAFAGNDEEQGWFFGAEATSLRPSGGPSNYVIVDPDDSNGIKEGTIQSIEIDNEIAPRVFVGFSQGNGGMWSLSWWQFDDDASESVSAASPSNLWATMFDANSGFDFFTGSASAFLAVEAQTIDLTYSRPLTNSDRFSTRWHVGLRSASLDHGLGVTYDDGVNLFNVALGSETDGLGFTGGLGATVKLSDKFMVHGGSSYSMLMGDFDTMTASAIGATGYNAISGSREGGFSILDAKCSIVWNGPDWLYLWLGYEFQQWNNVVETNNFPDDVGDAFLQTTISDVTFDGYTFGAGFKF